MLSDARSESKSSVSFVGVKISCRVSNAEMPSLAGKGAAVILSVSAFSLENDWSVSSPVFSSSVFFCESGWKTSSSKLLLLAFSS